MNLNSNEESSDLTAEMSWETAEDVSFETPEPSTEEDEGDPPFPIQGE